MKKIIIFSFLTLIILVSCKSKDGKNPPVAIKGIMDFSNWDINIDGPAKLNGEWEFYWKEFITSADFKKKKVFNDMQFFKFPDAWNDHRDIHNKKLPAFGYATFRLNIKNLKHNGIISFKFLDMGLSYIIYINGKKFTSVGKPGKSLKEMVPAYRPHTADFFTKENNLEIIIHLSNFHHRKGGPWDKIFIGTPRDIHILQNKSIALELFLLGSFIIIGLYHLSLFFLRKEEKAYLYFGIYTLLIGLFTITTGERFILFLFPEINWEFFFKLVYLSFYLSVPLFFLFIYSLFSKEVSLIILKFSIFIATVFSGIVLFTPARVYSPTMMVYQVISLLVIIYLIIVVIISAIRKRDGAKIFLFGILILFATMVNDILHDNDIINTSFFVPVGLFVFIFSQAFLLSKKFAMTFKKNEIVSRELVISNQEISAANEEFLAMNEELVNSQEEIERSERKVILAEAYLSNIFNSMHSILVGVDENINITMWNAKSIEFTGISEEEAIGKNFSSLFYPFVIDEDFIKKAILEKTPQKIETFKVKNSSEKNEYWDITIFPLTKDEIDGAVVRIDNVTESILKEEQLRQSQKMETVGTLAGGIAHDFNNVLGGIVGSLSLLRYEIESDNNVDKELIVSYLETMENSSNKAKDMTRQLLSLSSKRESNFVLLDLNQSIQNVMKICENSFDKSIELGSNYYDKPAMINGDSTQIEQMILNLCINASHSMTLMKQKNEEWGGSLNLILDKIEVDSYFKSLHPLAKKSEYWVISVKDTGVGMKPDIVDKIFTPFFTTKEHGKGTGLGLAMGFNIVQQHNGFINVYSEEGIGSIFTVYLPINEEKKKSDDLLNKSLSFANGTGTILIIDDDKIMRSTSEIILKKCGYSTLTAENGKDGVDLYRKQYKEIKAVLLDLVMPIMSGKEAYIKMKEINPMLKVLLSSGFRDDQRVEEILELGVREFLQKPYTLQSLSVAIKKTIDS